MTNLFRYRWLFPLIGISVVLGLWQGAVQFHFVKSFFLPTIPSVVQALAKEISTGKLFYAVRITIARYVVAVVLGTIAGVMTGLLFGRIRFLHNTFIFWIEFLRSLPVTALFPLLVAFFKTGVVPLLVASSLSAYLIMFVNTIEAFSNIPVELKRLATLVRLSAFQKWFNLYIPSMLPQLSQGMRNNVSVTFIVVIVSEIYMGVGSGAGYSIYEPSLNFNLPVTYSYILVTGFIGWLFNYSYSKVADKLIHWRGQ